MAYTLGKVSDKKKQKFAQLLNEDEELVLQTGLSIFYLQQKVIIVFMILLTVAVVLGLVSFYFLKYDLTLIIVVLSLLTIFITIAYTYILKESIQYLLTTRRVVIKQGYFNMKLHSAPYNKVTLLEVEQGFMDRYLLKHGKVIVHTAGSNEREVVLDYVDDPIELKNIIEHMVHLDVKRYRE
jgi:membrane protein YdbS with pleckstrin-like domain